VYSISEKLKVDGDFGISGKKEVKGENFSRKTKEREVT